MIKISRISKKGGSPYMLAKADVQKPMVETGQTEKMKIFCANCIHCKLVKTGTGNSEEYLLRVRCDAGKWKKKLGDEKFYKYFTVARRSLEECDCYEPMGEAKPFIKDLKKSLPIKDEIYMM